MPTNHTHLAALSTHLTRLAIDAQRTTDALLAELINDVGAELHLGPAASILAAVLDELDDALYRAEKLDQTHRSDDLAVARALACR